MKKYRINLGLTLIELLITLSILSVVGISATTVFINIKNIETKTTVSKSIQEELRFLMEKIVLDVKNYSIDYRGYYIMNGPHGTLGEATRDDSNRRYIGIPIAFPTGGDALNPAPDFLAPDKNEDVLLLLHNNGKQRIKYTMMDPDGPGNEPSAVMISKQNYSTTGTCNSLPEYLFDGSHNWNSLYPNPDYCWVLDSDYPLNPNNGYLALSSPEIEITELEFYFNVHKNPYKVYEENEIQFNPQVTIKITGKYYSDDVFIGESPVLTLQTTVASRNYQEIDWSTL